MKILKNLPDIFTCFDGTKVNSVSAWEARRAELADWFTDNVFGRYPDGAEDGFSFFVESESDKRPRHYPTRRYDQRRL